MNGWCSIVSGTTFIRTMELVCKMYTKVFIKKQSIPTKIFMKVITLFAYKGELWHVYCEFEDELIVYSNNHAYGAYFVVFYWGKVMTDFTHIFQGYFNHTGVMLASVPVKQSPWIRMKSISWIHE